MQPIAPRSFGTHDGSFHADEVTACALLLFFDLIDRAKVFRSRDPEVLARCEFVCDVGGLYDRSTKRFDHHQAEYKGHLSSAGMVLLYLREEKILSPDFYDFFQKSLFAGIDAHDNGMARLEPGVTTFSQVVSNFLPIEYEVSNAEMERAFFEAVSFVKGHLERMAKRHTYTLQCKEAVHKAMEKKGGALFFDASLPWLENFFELGGERHPAQFVLMPSSGGWKLRGIPPTLQERMKVRLPFPDAWAGLQNSELEKVTGIPGAIFCHKGRFISIWKTKEGALQALDYMRKLHGFRL